MRSSALLVAAIVCASIAVAMATRGATPECMSFTRHDPLFFFFFVFFFFLFLQLLANKPAKAHSNLSKYILHTVESKLSSSDSITCDGGSVTIKKDWVNDDFCDCQDGSDEPGTSACKNGKFYCVNSGHLPLTIPSQWVDDGHCGTS
jgi:hypothetical protein